MKFKIDFISNSSSTSFVYIANEELNEEAFFLAAGVEVNGPAAPLFHQMYAEIGGAIGNGEKINTKEDADAFAGRHEFTPDVIDKMKEAIALGKEVVTGKLSSDGALAESALCMEVFEIESDRFYINAYNNYW